MSLELAESKAQLETVMLLVEDKSVKLHSSNEKVKRLFLENVELSEKLEKAEYQC